MTDQSPSPQKPLWKRIGDQPIPIPAHVVNSVAFIVACAGGLWFIVGLLSCFTGCALTVGRGANYHGVDGNRWFIYHAGVVATGALLGAAYLCWKQYKVRHRLRWVIVIALIAAVPLGFAMDVVSDDISARIAYRRLRSIGKCIEASLGDGKYNGEIQTFLAADPDLPAKFATWERNHMLIMLLASKQVPDSVQFLMAMIEAGIDPNMRTSFNDDGSFLALTYEYSRDRTETGLALQELLLEKGANPNTADTAGRTPLHDAADNDAGLPFVRLLIAHGADINAIDRAGGQTPLDIANASDSLAIAQLLIDAGAK